MRRRVVLIVVFVLFVFVNVQLVRQTIQTLKVHERIDTIRARVSRLREENEKLQADLRSSQSDAFVEREAREKLGLVRPGEIVLYLPSPTPAARVVDVVVAADANWKKWWRLFFEN